MKTCVEKKLFGEVNGTEVYAVSIRSSEVELVVLSYGCIIQSLRTKDRDGVFDDIVTGWDDLDGTVKNIRFTGRAIGRYANRIHNGKFELDGKSYQLAKNNGENALHGGLVGFDKKIWGTTLMDEGVKFTHTSPDMDEGYPGSMEIAVSYVITDSKLTINYHATTDAKTVVNLTNHSYFNLDGHSKWGSLDEHELQINAAGYVPVDSAGIPLGGISPVADTVYDLTGFKQLTQNNLDAVPGANGYDHNYCCKVENTDDIKHIATLKSTKSGRVMKLSGSQPGLQFYTGNFVNATGGKKNVNYTRQSCLCLEPQHFPDSPNQSTFPTTILEKDQVYDHNVVFEFTS